MHVVGLRMNMISNASSADTVSNVSIFHANAHDDAPSVVAQQTDVRRRDHRRKMQCVVGDLPVTEIRIQLMNMMTDAQIPPNTFACQNSATMFKHSVRKMT
jgi:hypothetical protein